MRIHYIEWIFLKVFLMFYKIKQFLTKSPIYSITILSVGVLMVFYSFVTPHVQLSDSEMFFPVISFDELAFRFYKIRGVQFLSLFLILYPYTFIIFQVIFIILENILMPPGKDVKPELMNITDNIKYYLFMIINMIGLGINLYIYFMFYMMPVKSFIASILGIILLGTNLLFFKYFPKFTKNKEERSHIASYHGLNISISSFIYFLMILVIFIYKDVNIKFGFLFSTLGCIFLIIGFIAKILYDDLQSISYSSSDTNHSNA